MSFKFVNYRQFLRKNWIYFFSAIGLLYQIATLSSMFANDILSEMNNRMWGGFFPWWTIFFTFTFWSNCWLLICYFLYLVRPKMQQNHVFLYICLVYITLVLLVVAFALFPAAVLAHNSVRFGQKTPPLSYAALIMPHGPGPVLFIVYAFLIFNFYQAGNQKILQAGWGKLLTWMLIFFVPYLVMIISLNWIPIGAYTMVHHHQQLFPGYSVYSYFTDLNPALPYKAGRGGSPWHICFFLLGLLILIFVHLVDYPIIKWGIMKIKFWKK